MKTAVAASIFVVLGLAQMNPAAAGGSDTPKCKQAVQSITGKTGAKFDRVAPSGDAIYLKHPDATTITLFCSRYYDPFATIGRGSGSPPAGFYALVSRIAAVLYPGPPAAFQAASVKCQSDALKGGVTVSVSVGGSSLDCKATKDDGGYTSIVIGADKPN